MGSDLRGLAANGSAVHAAEFIVSSARLAELHECSALLRRTRRRAEEIVDEARMLLEEAERFGDPDRVRVLREQVRQARKAYGEVLASYMTIVRRINEERQDILRAHMESDRRRGLSGAA
jgi:DNA anti-recombination protein RmuC